MYLKKLNLCKFTIVQQTLLHQLSKSAKLCKFSKKLITVYSNLMHLQHFHDTVQHNIQHAKQCLSPKFQAKDSEARLFISTFSSSTLTVLFLGIRIKEILKHCDYPWARLSDLIVRRVGTFIVQSSSISELFLSYKEII
ncbi:hypothetical protein BpHYR1_040237 [Brachionus plicatilis]|uniref:Uncharacterized protein n=1 Tax=Brachionus plicatilis TaxID=10195 RepID=A0A3M7QJI6_BRAPC|nr:hypothetical protein BpHYR1_040237 [Brachionus plicatilis]